MKITISKKALVKYLLSFSGITKGSMQIPVLSMVLWEIKKEKVVLKGTDLNCGIICEIDAKTEGEGIFLLSTNALLEYVLTLGEGDVLLEIEKEGIRIIQGGSRANLAIARADEFPDLKKIEGKTIFNIEVDRFRTVLKRVGVSVAIDGTRPVLAGVYLKREGDDVVLVGTDGYRLGLENVCKQAGENFDLLMPLKSLNNVLRVFEDGNISFEIDDKNKQVWIKQGGLCVFIRLIEGSFPDFNKIIPKNFSTKLSFEKANLQIAINQTAVFARQNANIVKMEIGKNVKFLTQTSSAGSSEVEIDAKKEGDDCTIAFNYRYFKEILNIFGDGDIDFELNGSLAPVRIVSAADKNFFHIIMPVKL